MRALFGVVSLLVVVLVVGMLAKKQLSSGVAPGAATATPGAATPQQQVESFKQSVESAVQQPRPMPDNDK